MSDAHPSLQQSLRPGKQATGAKAASTAKMKLFYLVNADVDVPAFSAFHAPDRVSRIACH